MSLVGPFACFFLHDTGLLNVAVLLVEIARIGLVLARLGAVLPITVPAVLSRRSVCTCLVATNLVSRRVNRLNLFSDEPAQCFFRMSRCC